MVLIQRCDSYDKELILEKIKEVFEKNGGIEKYAAPGLNVVIKPNLISKKSPDAAATTHPSIVWAVAKLCKEAGANVIIAESPGGPYEKPYLTGIYKGTGMAQVAEETGALLNYDLTETKVTCEEAKYLKTIGILTPLAQADRIINLCKLKTHGMMVYTGAVKNMFGSIAGLKKAEYHLKMSDYDQFADSIIDIFLQNHVSLNIIDGIVGMHRDGPTNGDPIHTNVLISSENAFEADLAALDVICANPMRVPVFKMAYARGLCGKDCSNIDFGNGLKPEEVKVPEFIVNYNEEFKNLYFKSGPLGKILQKMIRPRPVFNKKLCRACHECEKCCPAKVITVTKENKAQVKLEGCIRCFCCQELCPFKAVTIKKPLINKIAIRSRNK